MLRNGIVALLMSVGMTVALFAQSSTGTGGQGTSGGGISTAAQVVALFSTCSGTQYLGADGACHTPSGGTGSVTSVSGLTPLFTVSNASTTPTFAQINQTANLVFASPSSGVAAAPTFRTLVAGDIGSGTGATSGTFLRGDSTWTNSVATFNATSGYQVNSVALASTNLSDTASLAYLANAQSFTALQTFPAGTACTSGGLNFSGQASNTFMYAPTATSFGFCIGGTNALTINSGGISGLTVPINNVTSATGAITTLANGNNPLVINCALTSGTTCLTTGETTASTTAGAVEHQITTVTTSTAIGLQITQGANGPANAAAPAILNVSAAAAGGLAGASNNGSTGAGIALLTGAGSAGGATTGVGGAGGAFTMTEGNGGAGGGTTTNNGGAGGGLAWTTGTGGNAAATGTSGAGGSVIFTLGTGGTTGTTVGGPGGFTIAQGTNTSATNVPALSITTTLNNASITGGVLNIAVTKTAAGGTAGFLNLLGGAAGATQEILLDLSGDVRIAGNFQSLTAGGVTTIVGGTGPQSASAALGGVNALGANQIGAGSAASRGGPAWLGAGSNAATNAASAAGGVEISAGGSTGATTGLQGLTDIIESYAQSGTVTQWNLLCYSGTAAKTVTNCGASPTNIAGVAEVLVSTTQVNVAVADSEIPINASAAVTVNDTVCAGTTAGQVTDSGGTGPCATGITVGTVIAVSGGYPAFPDGTAFPSLSTTLPLVRLANRFGVAGGDCPTCVIAPSGGAINQTGQTAAISTATLCSAANCSTTGQYHVHWNFWGSGTACSNVTAGSVTFLLTWTDENAVAHSAVSLQMMSQTGAATSAMQSSFPFQTALANESASGDFTFSSNGSIIQYATGYTGCTTGTGTYGMRATVSKP